MAFYRLQVPYRDKDEVKALGARWFNEGKYWYYDGDVLPEGLKKWYPDNKNENNGQRFISADDGSGRLIDTETGGIIEKTVAVQTGYEKYRSVSEINSMISDIVYATNEFRTILVKGEVTNYDGRRNRHYYFAIKDEWSLLPCVMWDATARNVLDFKLEKGQQVAISGSLEFYKEGGRAQLIVNNIENIGDGQANLALMRLKNKLMAEGLFDEAHKKAIPKHPETVGIITSKDGQAIKDICKVALKRNPYVQLILYHVNVQGANAVPTITKGIKVLDGIRPDTIIIGRGGGSDEELMVYNDESIARAVFEAETPIVSAVGHEGHWTLIDYVADKRVATPSEAAEETIPNVMVDIDRVRFLKKGILDNMRSILGERKLVLNEKKARLEQNSPIHIFKDRSEKLNALREYMRLNILGIYESYKDRPQLLKTGIRNSFIQRLSEANDRTETLKESIRLGMERIFSEKKHNFEVLATKLHGLSPTAKLINGFGYITKNDLAVDSVENVSVKDKLKVRIHDGLIDTEVTKISKFTDPGNEL